MSGVVKRDWLTSSIALDQPIIIAAAPAVGYLVAYLDRLGEALVYAVPLDYISVSVTDALSRVSVVVVAVLVMLLTARLETRMAQRLPPWTRGGLSTGATWLMLTGLALVLSWSLTITVATAVFGVFWAGCHMLWGWVRRKREPADPVRSEQQENVLAPDECNGGARLEAKGILIVVLVAAALLFAIVGGGARAITRDRYLAVVDQPEVVLLVVYADGRAVLGEIDADSVRLSEKRWLVRLSDGTTGFEWSDTGPLGLASWLGSPLGALGK